MLARVTVTGFSKYDADSQVFERLRAASRRPAEEQLLFLVADVRNKLNSDAVMLHDGVKKLGNVVASQAPAIRKLLDDAAVEHGQDQVIVMYLGDLGDQHNWSSLTLQGIGMIYERIARKYAAIAPHNLNAPKRGA